MDDNTPKYNESRGCGCALAFLSVTAICISLLALALVEPRTLHINEWGKLDVGFDYLGFIVAILAIMITLMVGWNIWQTITSREQIKDLEGQIDKSSQNTININLYNVFLLQGHNERKLNNPENALNYYVRALDCAHKESGERRTEHINELIRSIHGMIEPFPNVRINWDEGNRYIEIISQIEHHQKAIVIEYIRSHSFKDAPKSTEFGRFNTSDTRKPLHGSYDLITNEQAENLSLHKYRCPLCGSRRIIYSKIPYQLPYREEDYMIDEHFSHMTPAKCLYGECGDCGYVILRDIKPLLVPENSCEDTPQTGDNPQTVG